MPSLSRTHRAAMGGHGASLSVDGQVVLRPEDGYGGGREWLDDRTLLIQVADAASPTGVRVDTIHLETGARQTVDGYGANSMVAGAGVWAVVSNRGYRDSHGTTHARWSPHGVDDVTGIVAINRDVDHGGLALWDGQQVTDLYPGHLASAVSLQDGEVTIVIRQTIEVRPLADLSAVRIYPLPRVRPGLHHSRGYVLAWSDEHGLVVYAIEQPTRAIPISADGRDFNFRIRTGADGLVTVVSSSGALEYPHELRRYVVNPVLGTVNGETRATVDLTVAPAAPIPSVRIDPIPHPCWIAPFKTWTPGKYGTFITAAPVITHDWTDARIDPSAVRVAPDVDGPYFLGDETTAEPHPRSIVPDDRFLGHWLTLEGRGQSPDHVREFERQLPLLKADCIRRQRPLYLILDGTIAIDEWRAFLDHYAQSEPGLEIVPWPEMYASHTLTDDALEQAWDALFGWLRSQGYRVAACTTLYTQPYPGPDGTLIDYFPVSRIVGLQPRIRRIVVRHGVHLVAPFSVGRPGGVVTHSILGEVLDAWCAAVPREHPPLLVLPPVSEPTAPEPPPAPEPIPEPVPVLPIDRLRPDGWLAPGESLWSIDRLTEMAFQGDGNLVLYHEGTVIWASGTDTSRADGCVMQLDGNLVVYRGTLPIWASDTAGHSGAWLFVRHGEAVIVAPEGEVLRVFPESIFDKRTTPLPPPSSMSRPINVAKIVKDFFRTIGFLFGKKKPHPSDGIVVRPVPPPQVPAQPPVDPVPLPLRDATREEVLRYRGHLADIRDSKGRVIWTPSLHGVPSDIRAEWLRIYVSQGATHIPIGPFDAGEAYPGAGFDDAPDLNDDPAAVRALLDEIRSVRTVRGHGLIPAIFVDGGGKHPVPRLARSMPTIAKAIEGIESQVIILPCGWEPHAQTARDQWDAIQRWMPLHRGSVLAWHGWPGRSNGASNDPFNPSNNDPWLGDPDPVTGARYGDGAQFWATTPFDMFFYQLEPPGTMAEAECGVVAPPGEGVYPEGCWLDNLIHSMGRVGGIGRIDTGPGKGGVIDGPPWTRKVFVLFETTTWFEFRGWAEPGVTQRVNDRAYQLARYYGIEIGFGTGFPAGLEPW